jgi:hypothetical protein
MAIGCGEPSEAEREAAWARKADDAYREAHQRIAGRRPAEDLKHMAPVADAAADGRRAVSRIRRLERPGTGGAREVLAALDRLDPRLEAISDAAKVGDSRDLDKAAKAYRLAARRLEIAADHAGLKACGSPADARAVVDVGRAPVFAQQLRDLQLTVVPGLMEAYGSDRTRSERVLDERYIEVAAATGDGYDLLMGIEPPSFAVDETETLGNALRGLSYTASDASFAIERRGPFAPALRERFADRAEEQGLAVLRAFRRLDRLLRRGPAPASDSEAA